jgi:hypothetical protein
MSTEHAPALEPGVFSVCGHCRTLFVVGDDGLLREPTEGERFKFLLWYGTDPIQVGPNPTLVSPAAK